MPLCNHSLLPIVQEHLHDLSYEDKTKIYDGKCSGCGFAKITVVNDARNLENFVTNRIEEAVHLARMTEGLIERSCVYTSDVSVVFDKEIPITLNEIITNTCVFWDDRKVDCYSHEETEFIEVETMEELDVQLPALRCVRESILGQAIP